MIDNKSKLDKHDRPPLAPSDDFGFRYLSERNGITTDQLREITKQYEVDRDKRKGPRKPE